MTLMQLARLCGRNALVLKAFNVNENGPSYVLIRGRKSGFFNWLKSIVGLEDVTTVQVFDDRLEYSDVSRAGNFVETIPLSAVSNLGTGYLRPIGSLIKAIFFVAAAIVSFTYSVRCGQVLDIIAKVLLVLAGIEFLCYFFRKTLVLYFIPSSGTVLSIAFKRSLIEGVSVGREQAQGVIELISLLVRRNTQA